MWAWWAKSFPNVIGVSGVMLGVGMYLWPGMSKCVWIFLLIPTLVVLSLVLYEHEKEELEDLEASTFLLEKRKPAATYFPS